MTIAGQANEYLSQFETVKRGEDTIVTLKDNAVDELRHAVFEAHGEKLPNDWVFDKFHSILNRIEEYSCETIDDLEENRHEIVDGLVDVYTSDLTAWLNDHNTNVYYLTEALEEWEIKDGFQALQMAQYMAIDEIFNEVVELLRV